MKAVIFDLDDTLYDEFYFIKSGFEQVAVYLSKCYINYNYSEIEQIIWNEYNDSKKFVFNNTLLKMNINYDDNLIFKLINIYKYHSPSISLSNQVVNLLSILKKNNYKLGIITDGDFRQQQKKITALKLEVFFDFICITDSLGKRYWKPHPQPYLKTLNELEVAPEEAVYVGDNEEKDFITAKLLGIKTIRYINKAGLYNNEVEFYRNYYKAHEEIDNLNQLLSYLEKWSYHYGE